MRYAGKLSVNLYEAPYLIPARLQGFPLSSRCPAAIIQSYYDRTTDAYACMTLQPFDYGHVDNGGTLQGGLPYTPVQYDGIACQMQGDGGAGFQNFDELILPRAGGFTLGLTYTAKKNAKFTALRNGATAPCTIQTDWLTSPDGPLAYRVFAPGETFVGQVLTSYVLMCGINPGAGGYSYSIPVSIAGEGLPWQWYQNYFNFMSGKVWGSRKGILFGNDPSLNTVGFMPYGQFKDAYLSVNHWDFSVQITDDAAMDAEFQAVSDFMQNGNTFGYMSTVANHYTQGQAKTPVIFDPVSGQYWVIQFLAKTAAGAHALQGANSSYKLTSDGTIYFVNTDNEPTHVFHTYSLTLQLPAIIVDTIPPVSYPCFNPCTPHLAFGA